MSSTSMPWIKLYTEFIDDAKFASCSDSVKLRFVQLTLLAGECDRDGALISGGAWMSIDAIAWRLRVMADQLAGEIAQLVALGVVTRGENGFTVANFEKRQGRGQAEKREQWREQKRNQRRVREESARTPANVQPLDKEQEEEKDIDVDDAARVRAREIYDQFEIDGIRGENRLKLVAQLMTLDDALETVRFYGQAGVTEKVNDKGGRIKNMTGLQIARLRGWYAEKTGKEPTHVNPAVLAQVREMFKEVAR